MSEAGTAVAVETEKPERERRRRDRGSGCVYQPAFKGKDGETAYGSWRIKFFYEDPATGQKKYHDEKAPVDTKSAAVEYLIKRKAEVLAGTFKPQVKPETLTYEQMREALLDYYETEGLRSLRVGKDKDGKPRRYVSNLNQLDSFFRGYRAIRMDTDKVEAFRLDRKRAGASGVLINRSLSLLRRMFHLAVEKNHLRPEHVPVFKMFQEPKRKGFVDRVDFQKLRDALPERLRPVAAVLYTTGMRLGEVRNLQWDRIDLLDGKIRLRPEDTKNKTDRTIPLLREIVEMLAMVRAQDKAGDFVFGGSIPLGHFRKAWYSACCKTGLGSWSWFCPTCDPEKKLAVSKAGKCEKCERPLKRKYQGLVPHDFRRSAVRNYIRAGAYEDVTMKIVGHRTRAMLTRYNIVDERDVEEAVRKLERRNSESISQSIVKVDQISGTVEKETHDIVN